MTSPSTTDMLKQMTATQLHGVLGNGASAAAVWILAAAHEGIAAAQISYGRMLLDGSGVAQDREAAVWWFQRAAKSGDLEAFNMLGRCIENGWGAKADASVAADWYRRAANGGHAWAQYNLAHLYLDGCGVGRDPAHAFELYSRAAAQGHERAMNLLGRCHEEGLGTAQDFTAAAHWYKRSAEGGYFRGQFNWATILLKAGRPEQAVVWFERAAMSGTAAVRDAVVGLAQSNADPDMRLLAERLVGRQVGESNIIAGDGT